MIRELSWEVYRALDAVNPSTIKVLFQRSPRHALHEMTSPTAPTEEMVMGTLAHLLMFEPGRFAEAVVRFEGGESKRTKAWQSFRDATEAAGQIPLHPDDEAEIQAWADAVAMDPVCSPMVGMKGITEASIEWTDKDTGVACKSRMDRYIPGDKPVILEFKTAADSHPKALEWVAVRHGWDIAAAMRIDAHEAITGVRPDYWFIVVEKAPPHVVTAFRCGADLEEVGRAKYKQGLATFAECKRTGKWPGYAKAGGLELRAPVSVLREYQVEVSYGE